LNMGVTMATKLPLNMRLFGDKNKDIFYFISKSYKLFFYIYKCYI